MHSLTCIRVYQPDNNTKRTITRNDWMVRSGSISRTVDMIVTPAVQVSNCSIRSVRVSGVYLLSHIYYTLSVLQSF